MVHPVGWRLRAYAHGVSLSAFVLKQSPSSSGGGSPPLDPETYTLADYS